MFRWSHLVLQISLALGAFMPSAVVVAAPPPNAMDFLRANCLDCHDGDGAEAGFDLRKIGSDLDDPSTLANWIKAHDRVSEGEMPPKDYDQPSKKDVEAFARTTSDWISAFQQNDHAKNGRVRGPSPNQFAT